jgi:hypothetical protein
MYPNNDSKPLLVSKKTEQPYREKMPKLNS